MDIIFNSEFLSLDFQTQSRNGWLSIYFMQVTVGYTFVYSDIRSSKPRTYMHISLVGNYVPYNWFLNQTISHNYDVFFAHSVN